MMFQWPICDGEWFFIAHKVHYFREKALKLFNSWTDSWITKYLVLPEDGAAVELDDVPPFPLVWVIVEVDEAAAAAAAAAEVQNSWPARPAEDRPEIKDSCW